MNAVLKRHWGKLVLLVILAGTLTAVPFVLSQGHSAQAETIYHCPMHPTYTLDHPGDCPICGMRLVPIPGSKGSATESSASSAAVGTGGTASGHSPGDPQPAAPAPAAVAGMAPVHASADQLSLAGVRTAEAVTGIISSTVRAVGNVVADETRVRQVTTKIGGWIEKLHVNAVGQFVRAGDPLFDLYSPELLASQQEYLRARATAAEFAQSSMPEVRRGGQDLVSAGRRRLELFDVPQEFLDELERRGTAQRTITFRAPFSGYVTEKSVLEGQRIDSGMPLMTLSDLSRVWVVAQVYENEAAAAVPGRSATLSPQYDNTVRLSGRVSLVYPTMDAESRTIRVRFEVANPKLALKPGMFVNVELEAGKDRGVVVPESALIDTGTRQVVFVRAAGGQLDPREVVAGGRADGQVLIRTGLKAGETVAVAANFLLDSESRLRAAIGAMAPAAGHGEHK